MKNILYLSICLLLFSCGGNKELKNETYSTISFTLDTVMVDSGDEFLYLRSGLFLSSTSLDEKYLYNYDRNENILEKIDLDNLILEKKIKFEKEGPNGNGSMISNFRINSDDDVMMWFYGLSSVFDQNAKLVRNLELEKIAEKELGSNSAYPIMLFENPNEENHVFGFYVKWEDNSYFLLDFDTKNKSYSKIDLPEYKNLLKYRVEILYNGNMGGSYGVGISPYTADNKIILANNCVNDAYIYDFAQDSLYYKSWDTPLLGSKKTYTPPAQVEGGSKQLSEIIRKMGEDISYGEFHWDEQTKQYFRLSEKKRFSEELDEYEEFISTGAEVYLSIFDRDFELVAETVVPELTKTPSKHFVKDGKIWLFENIDDELAFVRLSIN